MGIDLRKTSHILFFVVVLSAMSFAIGWAFATLLPGLPFWVETVSPLAAYGLLYQLFEKYAWRWTCFRTLGVVRVPDVRGRWLGEQVSSYKDDGGKNRKSRAIMEITQTFSTISVQTYYKYWQSDHSVASFVEVDGACTLFVMFESTPKVQYDGDASAHKGVLRLQQLPNNELEGTYFTAAGRQGTVVYERTGYALHHTFKSVDRSV